MTTRTELDAVVTAWGDTLIAAAEADGRVLGRQDRQGEVDDLTGRLAAVQAEYDAHLATHAPQQPVEPAGDVSYARLTGATPTDRFLRAQGKVVTLPAGVIEGTDFRKPDNSPVFGIFAYQIRGLLGSGPEHSVLQVKPHTSTRAAEIPKTAGAAEAVNRFYVARVDGTHKPELAGFAVRGTDQGHMYNGLMLYTGSAHLHHVLLKGIPGDAAANPGETFPLNVFRQDGGHYHDFEVDGRDDSDTPVTASGVGVNFGSGHLLEDFYVHHTAHGGGIAFYETRDVTLRRGVTEDTRYYGLNFENHRGRALVSGHRFRRCAVAAPWVGERGVHVGIATNNASADYLFVDPDFDGPKFVVRSTGYKGKPKTQDDTRIRLVIDGADRPDLLEIRTR